MANELLNTAENSAAVREQAAFMPKMSMFPERLRDPKMMRLLVALIFGVGLLSLLFWPSKPAYLSLYNDMTESDAAQVIQFLEKEHIPYQLGRSNVVRVPEEALYHTRLKLASQGINPGSGVGYELFDKEFSLNSSNFLQHINLQRALQGELTRTIEVLPMIRSARVHLVMPKASAFAERERKATASVMLQLIGDRSLPKETVIAIQHLVAGSVAGLAAEDVEIMDSSGKLISSISQDKAAIPHDMNSHLETYRASVERRYEQRIRSMLEHITGAEQAIVRVSASIERQQSERDSIRYNPDEQVIRSQESVSEQRGMGAQASASGVPGLASNMPAAQTAKGSPSSESATRQQNTINYEISSVKEHRILPSGGIKRLTVAVVVNGHYTKAADDGERVFTPRSAEELKQITSLVKKAMGYDEDRGDKIDVQSMPLLDSSGHLAAKAVFEDNRDDLWLALARYGLGALIVLLLAWFVLRPLMRLLAVDTVSRKPQALAATETTPEKLDHESLSALDKARLALEQDPKHAAKLLQEWVSET